MKTLFIFNEGPYGSEKCYNGLRLAGALAKRKGEQVKIFLIGDSTGCAKQGQKVPQGYYNIEIMLKHVTHANGEVGVCSSCMDARSITDADLMEQTKRSSMEELTNWTVWADKVIVF